MNTVWQAWKKWFLGWLKGGPHFVIGPANNPYLLRWYIIPRNEWVCVYLHKFMRDDDDRALHDHPWPSVSFLVHGRYVEQTFNGHCDPDTGERGTDRRLYRFGSVVCRHAKHAHRIELPGGKPAWTLFVTGPRVREWGFHCPKGWVGWRDFVDQTDTGNIGKGCGEMA